MYALGHERSWKRSEWGEVPCARRSRASCPPAASGHPGRHEALPSTVALNASKFLALARVDKLHRIDALVHRGLVALALKLDAQAQLVLGVGVADRLLVADVTRLVVVEQRLVEGLHAKLGG